MDKNPYIQEAIDRMGGPVQGARKVGARNYQTLQQWVASNSIPPKYCRSIEEETGISRRLLRPNDWADYWPELGGVEHV